MQLLPETAQGIADRTGGARYTEDDLLRPRDQRPLRLLVPAPPARSKYRDAADATRLALAAYNAGQANVDRWIKATPPGRRSRSPSPRPAPTSTACCTCVDLYRRAYHLDRARFPETIHH